ncbi:MAG: hypothetical protein P8M80_11365, partial [Pirellulaceae bacterium]|nr:hypothetical protein [Pirellulaceae bacterium]
MPSTLPPEPVQKEAGKKELGKGGQVVRKVTQNIRFQAFSTVLTVAGKHGLRRLWQLFCWTRQIQQLDGRCG